MTTFRLRDFERVLEEDGDDVTMRKWVFTDKVVVTECGGLYTLGGKIVDNETADDPHVRFALTWCGTCGNDRKVMDMVATYRNEQRGKKGDDAIVIVDCPDCEGKPHE